MSEETIKVSCSYDCGPEEIENYLKDPKKFFVHFEIPSKGVVRFLYDNDNFSTIYEPNDLKLSDDENKVVLKKFVNYITTEVLQDRIKNRNRERLFKANIKLIDYVAGKILPKKDFDDFMLQFGEIIDINVPKYLDNQFDSNKYRTDIGGDVVDILKDHFSYKFINESENFIIDILDKTDVLYLSKIIDSFNTDKNYGKNFRELLKNTKFLSKLSMDQFGKASSIFCRLFQDENVHQIYTAFNDIIINLNDEQKNKFLDNFVKNYFCFFNREKPENIAIGALQSGINIFFRAIDDITKYKIFDKLLDTVPFDQTKFDLLEGGKNEGFLTKKYYEKIMQQNPRLTLINISKKDIEFIYKNKDDPDVQKKMKEDKENKDQKKEKIKQLQSGKRDNEIALMLTDAILQNTNKEIIGNYFNIIKNICKRKITEITKLAISQICNNDEIYDFLKIPLINDILNNFKDNQTNIKNVSEVEKVATNEVNKILTKRKQENSFNTLSNREQIKMFFDKENTRIEKTRIDIEKRIKNPNQLKELQELYEKEKNKIEMNRKIIENKFGIRIQQTQSETQTQTQQEQVQPKAEPEQKTYIQKLEEKKQAQVTSQINTDGSESDDEKRYKELYERYQNKDSNNNLSIKEMLEMRKLEKKLNVSQNQLPGK